MPTETNEERLMHLAQRASKLQRDDELNFSETSEAESRVAKEFVEAKPIVQLTMDDVKIESIPEGMTEEEAQEEARKVMAAMNAGLQHATGNTVAHLQAREAALSEAERKKVNDRALKMQKVVADILALLKRRGFATDAGIDLHIVGSALGCIAANTGDPAQSLDYAMKTAQSIVMMTLGDKMRKLSNTPQPPVSQNN